MPKRKVVDRADAERLLGEAAKSGLERAEWARRHGIDPRSLNLWRVNLQRSRAAQRPAALRLVELIPTAPAAPASYRVRCGALVVEVDPAFDDEVLGRLLAVVARC